MSSTSWDWRRCSFLAGQPVSRHTEGDRNLLNVVQVRCTACRPGTDDPLIGIFGLCASEGDQTSEGVIPKARANCEGS